MQNFNIFLHEFIQIKSKKSFQIKITSLKKYSQLFYISSSQILTLFLFAESSCIYA